MRSLLVASVFGGLGAAAACSSFTAASPDGADAGDASVAFDAPLDQPVMADAGSPIVDLVTGVDVAGIAVWDGGVYWGSTIAGGIGSVATDGGTPGAFVPAENMNVTWNPLATAEGLYWCQGTRNGDSASIAFRSWDDARATTLPLDGRCVAIAAANTGIVAAYSGSQKRGVQIASARLVGQGGKHELTSGTGAVTDIVAANVSDLLITVPADGIVFHYPPSSANGFEPFQSGQPGCDHIASNGARFFWSRTSAVASVANAVGGSFVTLSELAGSRAIAADDARVYWQTLIGAVRYAPAGSTTGAVDLAPSAGAVDARWRALALSASEVFWQTADQKIQKTSKPGT